MTTKHAGDLLLKNTFQTTWYLLTDKVGLNLETESKRLFQARAGITKKGPHKDEKVIIFYRRWKEYARSYPCCWGHKYNCNKKHIGNFCIALDKII